VVARYSLEGCSESSVAHSWGAKGDAAHICSRPLDCCPGCSQCSHRACCTEGHTHNPSWVDITYTPSLHLQAYTHVAAEDSVRACNGQVTCISPGCECTVVTVPTGTDLYQHSSVLIGKLSGVQHQMRRMCHYVEDAEEVSL
jgi:hypothetical protein